MLDEAHAGKPSISYFLSFDNCLNPSQTPSVKKEKCVINNQLIIKCPLGELCRSLNAFVSLIQSLPSQKCEFSIVNWHLNLDLIRPAMVH